MTQEYDYTRKRLGSKQPPYGRKIVMCAKCGRRGTQDGRFGNGSISVTHRSHLMTVAGITMNHTDEWCLVKDEDVKFERDFVKAFTPNKYGEYA